MTAGAALVHRLVDRGSLRTWDEEIVSNDPLQFSDVRPYRERLEAAADRSGTTEAVVTGNAQLGGYGVAVIAGEFDFMAGTVGVATGERIARAFERAVRLRLPVLALPASGGTRMQEGTPAFVQMVKTAAAAQRLRDAGLPYVVYLRDPTMGGVLASWASLGHVTMAAPGALIGFTGPRVLEATTGGGLPRGVQSAENVLAAGLVDDVAREEELRERVLRILEVVAAPPSPDSEGGPPRADLRSPADGWTSVVRSRASERPGARELLAVCASDVTPLRGDGCGGGDDPACSVVLARVRGIPSVVIAQDRGARDGRIGPAGFRKARRAMGIAAELGLPVVTIIDTPGAEISQAAEEGGLAAEIARCLATLSTLPCPTLAVLLGQGSGGGAIAFLPADHVLCAEHAWLGPIAPEGASAILYRTRDRAAELADAQGITATELLRFGIADEVVPEDDLTQNMSAAIGAGLREQSTLPPDQRLAARARRHRAIGTPLR